MLYLSTLKGATLHSLLSDYEDTDYYCFNPSVTLHDNRLISTFRKSNVERVDRNARYYLLPPGKEMKNEVVIGEFGDEFRLMNQKQVDLHDRNGGQLAPHGIEDLRLVGSPDGRLEGMGCISSSQYRITPHGRLEFDKNFSTRMARVQFGPGFEITKLTKYESPFNRRLEKNWAPFYWEGKFCVIYQWNPLIILELLPDGTSKFLKWFEPHEPLAYMRGSSQGLPTKNGYLFCIHRKCAHGGKVRFGHVFIELDHNLQPLRMTPEMVGLMTSKQIEYCAGVARDKGRYLLSFGLNDGLPMMLTVAEEQLESLMTHSLTSLKENAAALTAPYDVAKSLADADFPEHQSSLAMRVKDLGKSIVTRAVERFFPLQ